MKKALYVGMDQYAIVSSDHAIGTSGIGPCSGIIVFGQDHKDQKITFVCHLMSHEKPNMDYLELLLMESFEKIDKLILVQNQTIFNREVKSGCEHTDNAAKQFYLLLDNHSVENFEHVILSQDISFLQNYSFLVFKALHNLDGSIDNQSFLRSVTPQTPNYSFIVENNTLTYNVTNDAFEYFPDEFEHRQLVCNSLDNVIRGKHSLSRCYQGATNQYGIQQRFVMP